MLGTGSAVAGSRNTISIANVALSSGANTIYMYCRDEAENIASTSGTLNKIDPPPSMDAEILGFSDGDTDFDGLDGRDLSLSWDTTEGEGYSAFESYRLYLLPSTETLDTDTHSHVALIADSGSGSFIGEESLSTDSTGAALVSESDYVMCVAIMSTAGILGTEGCSDAATLTADTVTNPTVLSARFTLDTTLEITTDATLDTTPANHDATLISYSVDGNTLTGTSVDSVSQKTLTITIPSLGDLSATGSSLTLGTGAIRAAGGGFNNAFSSGSLVITDAQLPTVTGFSTGTVSPYQGFYSGDLDIDFTL